MKDKIMGRMKRIGQTDAGSLTKTTGYILAIIAMILIIIFVMNPHARDYIRNLPSFGYQDNKNVDEVIPDKQLPEDALCPKANITGKIVRQTTGPFSGQDFIYTDTSTALYIKDKEIRFNNDWGWDYKVGEIREIGGSQLVFLYPQWMNQDGSLTGKYGGYPAFADTSRIEGSKIYESFGVKRLCKK